MSVSFAKDIRPLFRPKDIEEMMSWFDLSKYKDVKQHASDIHQRVADGDMPCDKSWSAKQIQLLKIWMDEGMLP